MGLPEARPTPGCGCELWTKLVTEPRGTVISSAPIRVRPAIHRLSACWTVPSALLARSNARATPRKG